MTRTNSDKNSYHWQESLKNYERKKTFETGPTGKEFLHTRKTVYLQRKGKTVVVIFYDKRVHTHAHGSSSERVGKRLWTVGERRFPDRSISERVVGAVALATSCCETVWRPRPGQPRLWNHCPRRDTPVYNTLRKGSLQNVLNRFLNCTSEINYCKRTGFKSVSHCISGRLELFITRFDGFPLDANWKLRVMVLEAVGGFPLL